MGRGGKDRVRVEPFMHWLNERYAAAEDEPGAGAPGNGPSANVCKQIGWPPDEKGARRLYRYRRGLGETWRGRKRTGEGRRATVRIDTFPRDVVQDALDHAGGPGLFYEIYPEFGHERFGPPEPETWCPDCQEHVLVVDGHCVWCDWRIEQVEAMAA